MKWFIILAFWFLYWGLCFLCTGTDKKNLAGLGSYPDAVQSVVRERLAVAPKENSKNERHEFYQEFTPLVIIKHSVSAACQNDSAAHELLPDNRME